MLRRIGRLCYLVQTFAVKLACLRQASRAAAAPPRGVGRPKSMENAAEY